jgi:hypothetical protein
MAYLGKLFKKPNLYYLAKTLWVPSFPEEKPGKLGLPLKKSPLFRKNETPSSAIEAIFGQ